MFVPIFVMLLFKSHFLYSDTFLPLWKNCRNRRLHSQNMLSEKGWKRNEIQAYQFYRSEVQGNQKARTLKSLDLSIIVQIFFPLMIVAVWCSVLFKISLSWKYSGQSFRQEAFNKQLMIWPKEGSFIPSIAILFSPPATLCFTWHFNRIPSVTPSPALKPAALLSRLGSTLLWLHGIQFSKCLLPNCR